MKKYKLMGRLVMVSAVLKRNDKPVDQYGECYNRIHEWRMLENPRPGWIVGYSFRQDGIYVLGRGPDCPGELSKIKRVPCYLVRFWPTTKEVAVPINAISIENITDPWPPGWGQKGSDERRMMAKAMAGEERDNAGRWK